MGAAAKAAEGVEQRHVRLAAAAMLHALPAGDQHRCGPVAAEKHFHEGGLPRARLAGDEDHLALSRASQRQRLLQAGQLGVTADETGGTRRRRGDRLFGRGGVL
jgi:hypothetical protein